MEENPKKESSLEHNPIDKDKITEIPISYPTDILWEGHW